MTGNLVEELTKMRKEFQILVNRCGCSRASLYISKRRAEKWTKEGSEIVREHIPHCTPKKCFPSLYTLLYPRGGFRTVSYLVENYRKKEANKNVRE